LYNKYTYGKSVLELSFGRGGDLGKLFDNKVSKVVGYDIDSNSITEAKRRLSEYPKDFQEKVELDVLDLSTNVIPGSKTFDVVSCMFALHYFFRDESSLLTILQSIDNNLRVGGILMGTLFDGKSVVERIKRPFDDSHFKLERRAVVDALVGNTINVSLRDNPTASEIYNPENEYIVDFEWFVSVMNKFGYELVETKMFGDLFDNKFGLNRTEKDVSFLNRFFVFRRTINLNEQLSCIHTNAMLMK
jgi:mRNA (guanine-N7-)-methyltransferase